MNPINWIKERAARAKVAAREWGEARKERAAERAAEKAHDVHAHSRFWLLNVPATATLCAAIVEVYWAVLFCIEATGRLGMDWSTSVGSDVAAASAWHFVFDIQSVAVLVGLVLATAPIVMLSMIWLPVQFAMRGAGRMRRGSLIAVGVLANILVIVSGTVVMNHNRQDQVREAVVLEQSAQQGRAAIDARLQFEQEQLRLALNNSNPYLNQAANVGAEEWERSYVAQARATNDPRLPMLERALGAARAADQRRANIEQLTIERAQAQPEAATAAVVQDNVGAELNTFAQYVQVWRPPFVAFICTLIGIFGAWWTLAMLERLNPRDVLRSGWADEGHRIEDMREQEAVVPQPMKPAREVVTDAETGEELVKVKPREYWRKRKGQRQKLDIQPEIPPDETGVEVDGGGRMASATTASNDAVEAANGASKEQGAGEQVTDGLGSEKQDASTDPGDDERDPNDQDDVQSSVAIQDEPLSEDDPVSLYRDAGLIEDELVATTPEFTNGPDFVGVADAPPQIESPHVEAMDDEAQAATEQSIVSEESHHDLQEPAERDEPETDPSRLIASIAAQ